MRQVDLEFTWGPVLSNDGVPYSFPEAISKYFRATCSVPAVYRWDVCHGNELKMVYYGEAENLCRRTDGYRRAHPGQQTNAGLKKVFVDLLGGEHTVALHWLIFVPFRLNGTVVDEKALHRREVRCLLENALMVPVPPGVELLNKSASVEAKNTKKALDTL